MTFELSTHEYEMAHGKLPRGRGSWAFCPLERYNDTNYLDHVMWFNGTYAEAKKLARAYYLTTDAGQRALAGKSGTVVVCS